MLRTIKACSLSVNRAKWQALEVLAQAYAAEKADHLAAFNTDWLFGDTPKQEQFRDALLDSDYSSPHGLQARMWKMALKDGYETVLKQWAALVVSLRGRVSQQNTWSKRQKHYANWLLKDEHRLARLVGGRAPLSLAIELTRDERRQVQNYLRRTVRHKRGKRPQVRKARSVVLDSDMYRLFENDKRLYISVMNLKDCARIIIPLTGKHHISGNIRLILDRDKQRLEVHYTAEVDIPTALSDPAVGLDAGLTEVFTDDTGVKYGDAFGPTLQRQSDRILDKGKKRNKLYALEKKYRAQGKLSKASRLKKFNLGTKKLFKQRRQGQADLERQINTEINVVLDTRHPVAVVSEKLDIRGKAQSRNLSRRVSGWVRGTLDARLDFKASARGSCREHVNPAYSSQTCPDCGFLDKRNRKADVFQCLNCGHRDDADRVAATNLLTRRNDPAITLFTPKERVRAILLDRFTARLRDASGGSVSGWTPGTKRKSRQPESETIGTIQQIPNAKYD